MFSHCPTCGKLITRGNIIAVSDEIFTCWCGHKILRSKIDPSLKIMKDYKLKSPATTPGEEISTLKTPSAPSSGLPSETSNAPSVSKTRRPSSHRWLCYAFYVLGWLFLASWFGFLLFATDGSYSANVSSVQMLISSLGLLAVGRLIEVLQNIDDELYRKRMSWKR